MTYQVLVTSRSFGSTSETPMRILIEAGCEVVRLPAGARLDEDSLVDSLQSIDGWIAGTEPITAGVMAAAPKLRTIAKHGVGVDNIDLAAAQASRITVTNTPGANTEAVAELAIGLMFAVARQVVYADRQLRAGGWKPLVGVELAGKTLGIVGLGRIGRLVVRRLAGFEMNILAHDPARDEEFARQHRVRYCALDELLREADVVSLHAPVTPETRGLLGAVQLSQMKQTAFLINTARGELIDEAALVEALREKRIAGVGLDVFACEPPGDSPLFTLDNVTVTPHIGAHTGDAITAMSMLAAEDLVASLHGRPVLHRVV
jgi:D-3-phosphoglycerate dehydrogenase